MQGCRVCACDVFASTEMVPMAAWAADVVEWAAREREREVEAAAEDAERATEAAC